MKILLFYHSLLSDWNHGNAHFLRGVATELIARGHEVVVYEPADGWSLRNLIQNHGRGPLRRFRALHPELRSVRYDAAKLKVERVVADADLVLVHEWNSPELIRRLGEARRGRQFVLLFHDTHHRLVSDRAAMRSLNFENYDGVLAYGEVLRRLYLAERLVARAWTWHEAADTSRFRPLPARRPAGDLVWIGNWGDDERAAELNEFLIKPVQALGLKARVHGVRYPDSAKAALAAAGIEYADWLPNFDVPRVFAQYRVTLHVPRRPYVKMLPGIPTIRPFEAMACGIPLVCSPWRDAEHLFTPGKDYLVARTGAEMQRHLGALLADETKRQRLVQHALGTIRARHTCAHRVDELLAIHARVVEEQKTVVVPAVKLFRRKLPAASEKAAG